MKQYFFRDDGTRGCHTLNEEPTMTDQNFRDDCDANIILKKLMSGQAQPLPMRNGVFGDFVNMPSYQESLQNVINANDAFNSLPSEIRTRFQNDPQMIMDFLHDPKNLEESIKLGLREKKVVKPDKLTETLEKLNKHLSGKEKKNVGTPDNQTDNDNS